MKGMRSYFRCIALTALTGCLICAAWAQQAVDQAAAAPANSATNTAVEAGGVEVTADRLEYEADKKLMIGIGNVVVRQGEDVLKADCVTVHTETTEAYATGNVHFERGGQIWEGEELTYNFETGQGDFGEFTAFMDPYYVTADDSERISNEEYLLDHARITTCEGPDPSFFVRSSSASVFGQSRIKARNVVVFLGPIPIFYLPIATYDTERKTNIDFLPGYSSDWGAYILSAYNYKLGEHIHAGTHLDYRSKRGFGYGQDFKWAISNAFAGVLKTYYIDDDEPFDDEVDELEKSDLIDNERYRIRFNHQHRFTDRDYLTADLHYLSDPEVVKDFFREEYRDQVEPENRIALTHRGDRYSAGLLVNKRLNDFYENVDRLPELSLDIQRQRIGSTPFYYEGEDSATFLQRLYPDDSGREDYDAFRADSDHKIYYPTRHFGFLNVIPRVGYRATYYSKTPDAYTVTNAVEQTLTNVIAGVTNEVVSMTNEVSTLIEEGGADIRNLFEIGMETSFKAFKVLKAPRNGVEGGLRHVFEPYADYKYVPEPDLEPADIYQFDEIDELGRVHRIRFGMRNKFQSKRSGRIRDLVDLNTYTTYRVDPDEDEEDFGNFVYDGELRLVDWMKIDFDGEYDWYESQVPEFNTQVAFVAPDESTVGIEYRYRRDRRDVVAAETYLFPNFRWSLGSYWRYDLENSRMEEQAYFVEHRDGCVGWSLGYEGRGDDWDAMFRIWLVAMPSATFGAEGHY
jgi:lipopolysaccharide assembly outer membrane protein LptD (OstA)